LIAISSSEIRLLVAIDTADQAEDGSPQSREHLLLLAAFQHVAELVVMEVNFVEDPATSVVIIKHTLGEL
jgi:hypothetical protein